MQGRPVACHDRHQQKLDSLDNSYLIGRVDAATVLKEEMIQRGLFLSCF